MTKFSLFIVFYFTLIGCNLKLVPREKVIIKNTGYLFISDNFDLVFLREGNSSTKSTEKKAKGFYLNGKYERGFSQNLIRFNFDSCATFFLNKQNYLLADSLNYQSFLYDSDKIRVYLADIYYVVEKYKSLKDQKSTSKTNKYEFFYFSSNGFNYFTQIDRDFHIHVIGLTVISKCNKFFK